MKFTKITLVTLLLKISTSEVKGNFDVIDNDTNCSTIEMNTVKNTLTKEVDVTLLTLRKKTKYIDAHRKRSTKNLFGTSLSVICHNL